MSNESNDVLALLREIRDLQKAHFDRYVEFTSQVLEQQRRAAKQADADADAALCEQRRVGHELRVVAVRGNIAAIIASVLSGGLITGLLYLALNRVGR